VEVVAGYDRSGLIQASIQTLQRDLMEEAVIVSLVIIIFLFHFRSALIPIITLPIAVIASFIPMYYLHVSSNIMSLGGLALAIGVLVDAAIVMVENGYRHLSEQPNQPPPTSTVGAEHVIYEESAQIKENDELIERQRRRTLIDAAKQVGPALFFSLLIIVVSFIPPLFEGSSLYMPTSLPGISITQASQLLQEHDRVLRSFPEVESVFGTVGRSDSATDNAPLDMYDTTVMLKPREQWRPGMTYE